MSKYRPYTEKDMPAVHLCAVRMKCNNYVHTIVGWHNTGIQLSNGFHRSYSDLLDNFEFLDGSPCGMEENEPPADAKPVLPAVFLSGKDKVEQFKKELKLLLAKYDAELEIQDFGRNWSTDEKIVVTFEWDEDLSNRTNDGIVPDWVIGRWVNGR